MTVANVTEYQYLNDDARGHKVMVGKNPPIAMQTQISYGSGVQQSAVFNAKTEFIRFWADTDVYIAFGDNPTADSNGIPVSAGVAEYFGVKGGDRLSVIEKA